MRWPWKRKRPRFSSELDQIAKSVAHGRVVVSSIDIRANQNYPGYQIAIQLEAAETEAARLLRGME